MASSSPGSSLAELARLLARLGRALRDARGVAEELVVGEFRRAVYDELARALYQVKPVEQPEPERLKAEIARLLGLGEVEDLAEGIEKALRGSESSRAERVREGSPGTAEESRGPG